MSKWEYAILRDTAMPPDPAFLAVTAATARLLDADEAEISIGGGHVSYSGSVRYLYSRSKNSDAEAFMAAHKCVVYVPHNDDHRNIVCRRVSMNINQNIKTGHGKVILPLVKQMHYAKQSYFTMKKRLAKCMQELKTLKESHKCE
jgi:hypothetical protein